jgi:hypothetical protein
MDFNSFAIYIVRGKFATPSPTLKGHNASEFALLTYWHIAVPFIVTRMAQSLLFSAIEKNAIVPYDFSAALIPLQAARAFQEAALTLSRPFDALARNRVRIVSLASVLLCDPILSAPRLICLGVTHDKLDKQ